MEYKLLTPPVPFKDKYTIKLFEYYDTNSSIDDICLLIPLLQDLETGEFLSNNHNSVIEYKTGLPDLTDRGQLIHLKICINTYLLKPMDKGKALKPGNITQIEDDDPIIDTLIMNLLDIFNGDKANYLDNENSQDLLTFIDEEIAKVNKSKEDSLDIEGDINLIYDEIEAYIKNHEEYMDILENKPSTPLEIPYKDIKNLYHSSDMDYKIILRIDGAIEDFKYIIQGLGYDKQKDIIITDIPETGELRTLRQSRYISQTISTRGVIRNISKIEPIAIELTYICECGAVEVVDLSDKPGAKVKPYCSICGSKKLQLKEDRTKYANVQDIYIEELMENRKGSNTPGFRSQLIRNNIDPDNPFNPGETVKISGTIGTFTKNKQGDKDFLLRVNDLTPEEDTFKNIELTPEEEKKLLNIINDPKQDIINLLKNSILPDIYGLEDLKEGIVLLLVSGELELKPKTHNGISIFIVGDPGIAKSEILKRITQISPRSKYVNAINTTKPGLMGTVEKDEFSNRWTLESGAISEANLGVLCLDEIDKNNEIAVALNEAMAQHTSSIDKAGINTSIPINTNILACANPKKSQFDLLKSVFPQTQVIDPTTYSRFSLIYAIPDKSDKERDMEIARYINHKGYNEQALSDELIIKVIAYLKKNFNPVIVENSPADDKLIKFFADVRAIAEAQGNGKRITARDNDNIKNLAIAIARLNCEQVVSKQDVERAIDVYKKAMYTLELDLNTVGAISNVKSQNEQELDREAEDITIEFLEENGARPGKYLVEDLYKHLQASCNYSREQAKELFNELKSNY